MPLFYRSIPKWIGSLCLAVALLAGGSAPAAANSRIKDIVDFENVRENQLIGYGLVVGLNGTGDMLRNAPFTEQSLKSMLDRLGINMRDLKMNTKNVAAVTVTATLPPFARKGSRIDVQISAMGDASSLQGGTLLITPLMGMDGEVYAVAQGSVAVSGFEAKGAAQSISRGVTTSARITNGGIVEQEVQFALAQMNTMRLALKNPDFTTAERIASTINSAQGTPVARMLDPTTVQLDLPSGYRYGMAHFISEIERLPVSVDQPARIVVDEASGTIVMGADVKVSRVAIAQGNLTIRVTEMPQVSQPNPFSQGGQTAVVPRTNIEVDDGTGKQLGVLETGVSLQDLVNGLNALGVTPRDLITILQALRAAGALQAEVEVF
ncbi:MAG TPA: flagellar basal body P-ring protein FlgI [Pedomonas sp.]|uniref:flagellar basal body P-ring protein FlgI n=1 Tax=Pedomonas sp. TaxID=2976421 RepID=UPI002F3FA38C